MNSGKETWKWAVVVILLAIFLITANQAYQHIANQEDYAPPDDWQKPDSWDLEHNSGPGAGQPTSNQKATDNDIIDETPKVKINQRLTMPKSIVIEDDSEWSDSYTSQPSEAPKETPTAKQTDEAKSVTANTEAPATNQTEQTSQASESVTEQPKEKEAEVNKDSEPVKAAEPIQETVSPNAAETEKATEPAKESEAPQKDLTTPSDDK